MVATRFVVVAAAVLALGMPASAAAQAAAGKRSVESGVYSETEANRGKAEFQLNCSACHQADWFGGEEWKEHWGWGEVFWFYDFIRTNMPYNRGGELPQQTYRDIVAYVLQLNGFPAGQVELPRNDEGWMEIVFPEARKER